LKGEDRHTSKLARELTSVLRSDLYKYSFQLLIEQIQMTVANWRSKARVYYRLRQVKDDASEKTIPELLHVLNLQKEDIPSLRFFTTGFRHTMLRVHLWQKLS